MPRLSQDQIRRKLEHLVEDQIARRGCDSFLDFNRKFGYSASLFDGELCTLVNPLCPDDLCYLPYGHIGAKDGYHITGTVSYAYAERFGFREMAPEGTSRSELIRVGAVWARRLENDPKAPMPALKVCQIPACGCDGTPHS